ncbi:FAD-dependent oxidoreductase [Bifidobacterium sp. ESL0682]|uniref:dihydrolipoyl dehydrogenase family protein n=1 Tax=Bifidobacterium sp. ESL0682 TaxID=2983212 RepID=UPI0023FA1CD2|nr:FAD-dependent oxidoreductase [Bifidobacterium sp. ESL0682]WEV41413.1 FAD-dependent oxidoreductase [Bifidobacterium sp. ESL0682]
MQTNHFDIAIIGGGPGGYATALRASQLGLSVALINREDRIGGTCLNRGCIPSKALITATRAMRNVGDAGRMGINARIGNVDFPKLAAFKDQAVTSMTDGLASLLEARKVTVIRAEASITAPHTVSIEYSDGDDESTARITSLQAEHIVVATGSRPRPMPEQPFCGALIDSTQALALPRFPQSAVVIGAGAVAVEFASMWNAAGVDVTLLIRHERVLSHAHRRTAMALTRALSKDGIHIVTHSEVTDIKVGSLPSELRHEPYNANSETAITGSKADSEQPRDAVHDENPGLTGAIVTYHTDRDETEQQCKADVVLSAIGRDPNTDGDWFATADIDLDEHRLVKTDAYGRTSQPGIWALGDITPGPALAYHAFEQGIVIAESIAGLDLEPVNDDTIPEVVFSTPEFASVGLTIDEAKNRKDIIEAQETAYPMMGNARVLMSGEAASLSLVSGTYADRPDTPVVLGVHMLAPDAGDLIAEAEELVGNRVSLSDAARLIHPHPTFSEALGETLLKADGRPLHTR